MEKFVALSASGVAYGAVLAIAALGFLVLYNATGVINFAHGDLITLGTYFAVWATLDLGLSSIPAYVLALVAMIVVGVVFERIGYAPLRSRPPVVVMIGTLAMALVIRGLISLWQGSEPKSLSSPVGDGVWRVLGASIALQRVMIVVVAAIAVVALLLLFSRTSFGRQVRALANDSETAQLLGIRVRRVAVAAFVLSTVLAGLAGILIAPLGGVDINFGFNLMLTAFAAAVIGGFGSIGGAVLAGLAIGLTQQLLGGYIFTEYSTAIPAVLLLVVIAIRPEGLMKLTRSRL